MYRFGKYLAPTPELLRTLSRALLLSVSCFLQDVSQRASQKTAESGAQTTIENTSQSTSQSTEQNTEQNITMEDCLRMISTCREVMKKAQDDSMETANRLLYQLEFYALVHSRSPALEAKLTEITQTVVAPYSFYLDIYYLSLIHI